MEDERSAAKLPLLNMSQPPTTRFGLQVKFAIFFICSAVLSAVAIIALSGYQQEQQFLAKERRNFEILRDDFYYLSNEAVTRLNVLAEQIASFSRGLEAGEELSELLQNTWDDLELLANLKSVQFYNATDARPQAAFGELPGFNAVSLAQDAITNRQPQQQVTCDGECSLLVATPILGADGRAAMVLEQSLMATFMALAQLNDVNVGLLTSQGRHSASTQKFLAPWRLRSSLLTREEQSLPLLQQATRQYTLDEVVANGVQIELDGSIFMLQAFPLTDLLSSGHYLVIIDDVSDSKAQIGANITTQVTSASAIVLVFAMVGLIASLRPIRKIRLLLQHYQYIANEDYEQVRKLLPVKPPRFYDELDLLSHETVAMANHLEVLNTALKKKADDLEFQAMHDKLTGLGNRNLFMYELEKQVANNKRSARNWALIFLDLDKFKQVNDTLGHDVGDQLLQLVAQRLKESLRKGDTVCRLGGDEFTVILSSLKRRADVKRVLDKIYAVMQQPAHLGGKELAIGCSAGAVICDDSLGGAQDFLKAADLAMYEAKREGRNRYQIFDEDMSHAAKQNFIVENEFHHALKQKHFLLHLQPQINLRNGRLFGFEALVRWQHPLQGKILPGNFIPILEESNRINELGRWVAAEAIKAIAPFTTVHTNLTVSINLSNKQLNDDRFLPHVIDHCLEQRVRPEQVIFELTESALIADLSYARNWMENVSRKGFKLAIDDFGTGYSSLSHMSSLPFDTVKLDRSFVQQLFQSKTDRDVLGAIVNMVHKMGRLVVAEGIEDPDQFVMLKNMRCDVAQGYLIQRPLSLAQLNELMLAYDDEQPWETVKDIINMEFIGKGDSHVSG